MCARYAWGTHGIGHSPAMCFPRKDATPGEISAVEVGYRTVWGFSNIDFAPGEYGAVELDFRQASFPPGENGVEESDYIRPAPLAGPSVCTRTVTGSLLFGSPHRLVRSCLYSCATSTEPSRQVLWHPVDRLTWMRRVLLLLLRIRCRGHFLAFR